MSAHHLNGVWCWGGNVRTPLKWCMVLGGNVRTPLKWCMVLGGNVRTPLKWRMVLGGGISVHSVQSLNLSSNPQNYKMLTHIFVVILLTVFHPEVFARGGITVCSKF